MTDIAWETAHTVDANVSPAFAWQFMSDVSNWDDPPAKFELNGPFATASPGKTHMPELAPMHWLLSEVSARKAYTIEMALGQASISFEWRFDGLSDGRTRISQHIVLMGENAVAYVEQVRAAFAANLAQGMSRIAKAMEAAGEAQKS